MVGRKIELPPDALAAVTARAPRCILCAWILLDLKEEGFLSKHPRPWWGGSICPPCAKVHHLRLEGIADLPDADTCTAEPQKAPCGNCDSCELPRGHREDLHMTLCGFQFAARETSDGR